VSSEHVILGIVGLYPCSGYDIKVEVEQGGAGLLSGLNFGSIYPRLKQLERDDLIETRQASVGGRQKKVHDLTGKGWQELAAWLAEPTEYPIPLRDDLLLKMMFWGAARPEDRDTLIEHLHERRDRAVALLSDLEGWSRNGESLVDEYALLILEYLRTRLEAELAWIDATITQLEGPPRPPAQDPRGLVPRQQERRAAALQVAKDMDGESATPLKKGVTGGGRHER